jgi:hypothetical protein
MRMLRLDSGPPRISLTTDWLKGLCYTTGVNLNCRRPRGNGS